MLIIFVGRTTDEENWCFEYKGGFKKVFCYYHNGINHWFQTWSLSFGKLLKIQSRVILLQLTEYELCIASNLIDPSSMVITWEDIGGLDDVVQEIKETVILPFARRDLFLGSALLQPPKGNLAN